MDPTLTQAVIMSLLLFVGYLYCCFELHRIIKAEHPEWLVFKGSLSFFIRNAVAERIIAVVFSAKASQLRAPMAFVYVVALRIIVLAGILLFCGAIIYSATHR